MASCGLATVLGPATGWPMASKKALTSGTGGAFHCDPSFSERTSSKTEEASGDWALEGASS